MTITFQRTLEDIVPGRPSWWVVRDGVRCERVWRTKSGSWCAVDADGVPMNAGCADSWGKLAFVLYLPADTPEPVVQERGETVEVPVVLVIDERGYAGIASAELYDAHNREYDGEGLAREEWCHLSGRYTNDNPAPVLSVQRFIVTAEKPRVVMPTSTPTTKPAEVVGEVSDG